MNNIKVNCGYLTHFVVQQGSAQIETSGVIVEVNDNVVYKDQETGLMCTIPKEDILRINREQLSTIPIIVERPKSKVDTPIVRSKKSTGTTKLDLAIGIMVANRDLTKQQIIEKFIAELNMTHSGASTYYYNAKSKMPK